MTDKNMVIIIILFLFQMENPWNIDSLYEFLYFNCPSCVFKNNSKQDFINHVYKVHPDCVHYLEKVKDNSLVDVFCPWNMVEIKKEPVSYDSIPDPMYEPINIEPHVKIEQANFHETVNTNDLNKKSEIIVRGPYKKKTYCMLCIDKIDHKIHICKICSNEFEEISGLKEHFKAEHKEQNMFSCEMCGKLFTKPSVLQSHIKTVHEGRKQIHKEPKKFECETCGKIFSQSSHLKVHVKTVHEGIKDYKCDSCDKNFGELSSLKRHIKVVHEGHKNFSCESCGKTFSNSNNLQRHVKIIHEGLREHKCDICFREFGQIKDLKTHIKFIHQDVKIKICKQCKYRTTRTGNLKTHIDIFKIL